MNTANNKRRKDSQKRIENAFVQLLQNQELDKISVTQICQLAKVNRTTFYANYLDIYDLADAVQKRLEEEVLGLSQNDSKGVFSFNFLKLFQHIKENQLFYKTYFKLGHERHLRVTDYDLQQASKYYDNQYIEYHLEFFRSGLNAVIKKWLQNDCAESPEEIYSIIVKEYELKY